jgi:hypothetical protein
MGGRVWLLLSHDSRHLRELGLPSAPCRGYEDWITRDRSWKGLVQGRSSARQKLVSLALLAICYSVNVVLVCVFPASKVACITIVSESHYEMVKHYLSQRLPSLPAPCATIRG